MLAYNLPAQDEDATPPAGSRVLQTSRDVFSPHPGPPLSYETPVAHMAYMARRAPAITVHTAHVRQQSSPTPRRVIGNPSPTDLAPTMRFPLFPTEAPFKNPAHIARPASPVGSMSIRRKPVPYDLPHQHSKQNKPRVKRPAVLDWQMVPHIVDRIMFLSLPHSLHVWRQCSQEFKRRVDKVFHHATVSNVGSIHRKWYIATFRGLPSFTAPFPRPRHPAFTSTRILDFIEGVNVSWHPTSMGDLQTIRVLSNPRTSLRPLDIAPKFREAEYWIANLVIFHTNRMPYFPGHWDASIIGFNKVVVHLRGCRLPKMDRILHQAAHVVLIFGPQGIESDKPAPPNYINDIASSIANILKSASPRRDGSGTGPMCTVVDFDSVEPEWTALALRSTARQGGPGVYRAIERVLWQDLLAKTDISNAAQLEFNTWRVNATMKRLRFMSLSAYKATITAEEKATEFEEYV